MAARHTMKFLRQPWYIGFALAQPIIYLCFFGQLFQRVANLPGFGGGSYVAFLTPGLVVMNAVFSAGWTGMGIIDDINRGIMDRFLITPAGRFSLIGGRLLSLGLSNLVQAGILLGLGWLMGARLQGGFTGVFVLLLSSILPLRPVRGAVVRDGADVAADRVGDRSGQLHPLAVDVPLARLHGHGAHAALDSSRRAAQSRRLERNRSAGSFEDDSRLGPDRGESRAVDRLRSNSWLARYTRVRLLPTVVVKQKKRGARG